MVKRIFKIIFRREKVRMGGNKCFVGGIKYGLGSYWCVYYRGNWMSKGVG